jgi:protein translocase SecG subunit
MNAINIGQIIVAVVLTVLILMQSQGTGLSSTFSGGGESYHTKRGMEKVIFKATIALAVIFTVLSILALL